MMVLMGPLADSWVSCFLRMGLSPHPGDTDSLAPAAGALWRGHINAGLRRETRDGCPAARHELRLEWEVFATAYFAGLTAASGA